MVIERSAPSLQIGLFGGDDHGRKSAAGAPTGTVTFGFCEIDEALGVSHTHRPDATGALSRVEELIRDRARSTDGHLFVNGGDSYGVAFHRATDAVRWAVEVQDALDHARAPGDAGLGVGVGLHTGEAEESGASYFGPSVNLTGEIAATANPGQILASATTACLLDRRDLVELGSIRLGDVAGDWAIVQIGEGRFPPLRSPGDRRGNLPRGLGRLIGRTGDLDHVVAALSASAVVTLVGPGGIGKTRLAIAAARTVAARTVAAPTVARDRDHNGPAADGFDETWLVELAGVGSSAEVPWAVAEAIGVSDQPPRPLTDSIVAALGSRRALLVLDNCEHVVDGAAALVSALVDGCPEVHVLTTSREGLGHPAEQLVAVAPLDPAGAAIELFVERAVAADRTFDGQAERADIEEICRRLDGVPLAIELAAARTGSLSAADLMARLDDRLRLLTGGRRTSVERHRTLRAALQWSYDMLTRPEQIVFQRLSIFVGPFDLAAAELVAAGDSSRARSSSAGAPGSGAIDDGLGAVEVDDLLGSLVAKSMVTVESGPFGRRFRVLETMRQFGAENVADGAGIDRVARRHADWCLREVTRIHALLTGSGENEGVARLAELWTNLRAAVDWSCASHDAELAFELVRPIAAEASLRARAEIGDWIERILEILPADDIDRRSEALSFAGR